MARCNGASVALAQETVMKKKVLVIGGIAAAVLLAGGYAFAQMGPHGPGMGPGMMRMGPGTMHGPGGHMGPGNMGPGNMGPGNMGPGMMHSGHDAATQAQLGDIHALLGNHDKIKRTVTNLPDGIRTVTESDDPKIAALIKTHVDEMGKRVRAGDNPNLPIQSPALNAIYRNKDKIQTTYEQTEKGIVVVQTSKDAATVAVLQQHAAEVTDLVRGGMAALHSAMMRNHHGGMMGMMMHGPGMHGPQADTPRDTR